MEPEEKAKELDNKMFRVILKNQSYLTNKSARKQSKACAIICVDEIIAVNEESLKEIPLYHEFEKNHAKIQFDDNLTYWQSVKQSLNKTL